MVVKRSGTILVCERNVVQTSFVLVKTVEDHSLR